MHFSPSLARLAFDRQGMMVDSVTLGKKDGVRFPGSAPCLFLTGLGGFLIAARIGLVFLILM